MYTKIRMVGEQKYILRLALFQNYHSENIFQIKVHQVLSWYKNVENIA